MGYERMAQVDGMGQFSIRGGIVDIFPLTEEQPLRIELWGDEVDSIRTFDPESQRSIAQLSEAVIYPAAETVLKEEQVSDGLSLIEKEGKRARKRNSAMPLKTEEAHRIFMAVKELSESLREGFDVRGLDGYIHYFVQRDGLLSGLHEGRRKRGQPGSDLRRTPEA